MATVKFRLKGSENKPVSIFVRLSLGRGKEYETKTGFTSSPNDWSSKTSMPKTNSTENKQLNIDLKKLESFILDSLNKGSASSVLIDTNWLKEVIKQCFGRVEKTDEGLLINHIDYIIRTADTRPNSSGGIGLAERTVTGYGTFKNMVLRYEKKLKRSIHLLEIDKKFVEAFKNWMFEQNLSTNYVGKNLDRLASVCRDAKSLDIKTNDYVENIKGFSESDEDRYIITLSFDEIKQIEETQFESGALDNAKKWMLIGCSIGQRVADLLRLTPSDFRYVEGKLFLDVKQQKTNKEITVPILSEKVIRIIENEMPHAISEQKLNEYIKDVCKLVGIDKMTIGKKIDPETKRKLLGTYPKYELVTSHCFRRSFATNYYKSIPTPVLMTITGHTRESTFLQYINKKADKDDNAMLFIKYLNEMDDKKEPKMKLVKVG